MKKFLAITLVALTGLLALPETAQAGPSHNMTYRSGQSACGCPIYTQRILTGWDSCRRPIYRYVGVPVNHRCGRNVCRPRPILRTSSCAPWVRPHCGTRYIPTAPRCRTIVPSRHSHHSSSLIRIRFGHP